MPSYITHAIMADRLHLKLKKLNIKTNRTNLKLFSIIPNLASNKTNNHNINTEEYILYLINYIKDNNLINDTDTKTLLYGIISHYYLDTITHPFIYSIEYNNQKKSIIKPHHYIEGYLNYYIANKIMHKDILLISPSFSTKGTISIKNEILLNKSYKKFYGTEIINTINFNLRLIKIIEYAYKKIVKNNSLTAKLSGYYSYLKKNNLSSEILDNRNHNIWINPFTNEESNKSFIDLYNESLLSYINTIKTIELFFNDIISIDNLYNIFNKSYDTGTNFKLKKVL